ncbi:MAG TPA: hypothetical protein VKS81_11295, partial [Bacteroidota bacterium]|nr:hypothetical protein [Bacteroidota bacterium]
MKTIFASLLFLIGCLPVATFSQSPVAGKGDFHIDLDAGKFYGDESRSMIEIYYSVRTSMLAHTEQGGAYTGGASIRLQVWKDSSMLSTKTISVPFSFTDTAKLASGQMLVGIEQIALVPGEYRLRVRGWDQLDSTRIDTFTMPLHVASFAGDKEMFSDIELASSVAQSSDTTSIFYKNTLAVVPNASMLYGPGLPFVYYYYEVYN